MNDSDRIWRAFMASVSVWTVLLLLLVLRRILL